MVDESVPLFDQQLYNTTVKENVELKTPLMKVEATSPTVDKITGKFSQFSKSQMEFSN